ncbi:hypothetical protein B0T16DRAFT_462149 [Cercophora newfieldiana]|uniref:BTB domain-containing protein n=1 Tax=Cercophora newfieldiana TaxID=92897 RepID=A0AA39XYI9_9PEZI|nr:hypothetical protein B0T16DRAFT_462149 [Cercophora newfieldiana]
MTESTTSARNEQGLSFTPRTTIDPEGDVILHVSDDKSNREFLVSSKILTLASPVFAKMFGPHFQEGIALRSSQGSSTVRLEEDNPDAMGILLAALHFQTEAIPGETPGWDWLANLAVLSDKYDCNRALRPWIELWIRDAIVWLEKIPDWKLDCDELGIRGPAQVPSTTELGKLIVAGCRFKTPLFRELTKQVIVRLPETFLSVWDADELCRTFIPDHILEALQDKVNLLHTKLEELIQDVAEKLRATDHGDTNTLRRPQCLHCCMPTIGMSGTRKCRHCNRDNAIRVRCTGEVRASVYFNALDLLRIEIGDHPADPVGSMGTLITGDLSDALDYVHRCTGGMYCVFKSEAKRLGDDARKMRKDATGISLEGVFSEDDYFKGI